MKNYCIALCGKTGCGKSEITKFLVEKYGFKEYSFGEPIRNLMKICLPNIDYHTTPKARKAIIDIAEAPKKIAPKCWAYALTERIIEDSCPNKIVISDLRFEIELEHLKETICNPNFENYYKLALVHITCDFDRHTTILNNEKLLDKVINEKQLSEEDIKLSKELDEDPSNTEHMNFDFNYSYDNVNAEDPKRIARTLYHTYELETKYCIDND